MFTSRAEHRLVLRYTNANRRLGEKAFECGLIDETMLSVLNAQIMATDRAFTECETSVVPEEVNKIIISNGSVRINQKTPLKTLLKRPELLLSDFNDIAISSPVVAKPYKEEVLLEADTLIKYRGYIDRSNSHIKNIISNDMLKLYPHVDYSSVSGLSVESKEKLGKMKPETLGQAMRISGVTPADISVLSLFISKQKRVSRET
jgi:tRNA uridine 5-carboxymethylaminomethyl modification enzyme